ncbi:PqiC family protein [Paenalcaligenes niemegkensis]|uniref:PqiC family protein n=1 Tax=Paenalcaligenes niemegkensis TaxID=2895469 RepID=UPI001EE983EC|nr:PqiC family protein [Paenalcaligenes niemegkensis]MCQ9616609.1 PqiC family protein [Paenalcaligenes niemegkensis]
MRMAYGVLTILLLSACATAPPTRHFSLQPDQALTTVDAAVPAKAILLQKVMVPTQLDKRQMVLTQVADQEVQVLNDYQWASPLADEIHQALTAGLTQRLGVPSAELSRPEDRVEHWRIDVEVQRFDSVFDQYVRQDLSWRISPVNFDGKAQLCRISLRTEAGTGVEGLALAHQRLQSEFIDVMIQQMNGAASIKPADEIDAFSCVI